MALRKTEEEVLWKSQVLTEKRPELCQCLTPRDHYPWLRSRYVLGRNDEEIIESQVTTRDKVHKLIDILLNKLPQGFDELVKSLIEGRTQTYVAKMLNEEFETKRRNCYSARNHVNKTHSAPGILYQTQGSISDLGVDTDKLPKPQLPKIVKDIDKNNDTKRDAEKNIILELEPEEKYHS